MRIIVVLVLLLVVGLSCQGVQQRGATQKYLDKALLDLPRNPHGAYNKLKDIYEYGNLLTLGKVSAAEEIFLVTAKNKCVELATSRPLEKEDIEMLVDALDMLEQFKKHSDQSTKFVSEAIVDAVYQGKDAQQREGHLEAWDEYVRFFEYVQRSPYDQSALPVPFGEWLEQLHATSRQEIGLRDRAQQAAISFYQALGEVGIAYDPNSQDWVNELPGPLPEDRLATVERYFQSAESWLMRYEREFNNGQMAPEYTAMHAAITYNRGALKLGHIQDVGAQNLRRFSSTYLAELLIPPGAATTPSPAEMYGTFVNQVHAQFKQAGELFRDAQTLSIEDRKALFALCNHGLALVSQSLKPRDNSTLDTTGMNALKPVGTTGRDQVWAMVESSQRGLIMVKLP